MSPNWIALDGVVNMRDVGGLATADGHRIRTGRLIRSDNLQDLTAADVRHLVDGLGITDVVDLRTHTEFTVTGPGPLRATRLRHHHHSLMPADDRPLDEREASASLERWSRANVPRRPDADYWSQHYLGYLHDRPDSVAAALEVIASSAGGTIVHCAAGKDRTGTVVGLALSAVGVADEDIVADYLASAERIDAILGRLVGVPPYDITMDGTTVANQTPRAESMEQILHALREGFGGAAGWLRAAGWSEANLAELHASLVG